MMDFILRIKMWLMVRKIEKEIKKAVSDGVLAAESADEIVRLVKTIQSNKDPNEVLAAMIVLEVIGLVPSGTLQETLSE